MKRILTFLAISIYLLLQTNVCAQTVTGSGTVNYVPRFSGTSSIVNSLIQDNGSRVIMNGASDDGVSKFLLNGGANFYLNSNFNPSGHIQGHYLQGIIGGTFSNQTNQYLNENIGLAFALNATGTTNLMSFPGMNSIGSSIYKGNTGTINGFVSNFRTNYLISNSGSVSDLCSYYGGFPLQQYGYPAFTGTISNFYGLYLSDVTTNSDVQSRITNKWGLYQSGSLDRNYLAGNTLIGTNVDAGYKLNVNGSANISGGVLSSSVGINGSAGAYQLQVNGTSNFQNTLSATSANFSGPVGIGTTNPGPYSLAVEGTVAARKIKVTMVSPWADYVFNDSYVLRPLSELASYIKQNKHLPDIPAEREVKEAGIDISETTALLLKKIEELTLYIIKQEEQINQLTKDVKLLHRYSKR